MAVGLNAAAGVFLNCNRSVRVCARAVCGRARRRAFLFRNSLGFQFACAVFGAAGGFYFGADKSF